MDDEKYFEEKLNEAVSDFLKKAIVYTSRKNKNGEDITFFKTTVEFDNGGVYLLSLMHVLGEKVRVKND